MCVCVFRPVYRILILINAIEFGSLLQFHR